MNERDKLIAKYASDLKEKCRITPDMDLLTKVTLGCGPSIYNIDSSILSDIEFFTIENHSKQISRWTFRAQF